MHTTNLRKVGGSIMLSVPPALLRVLDLREGLRVDIGVEDGRLVVEPKLRPKYTLRELIDQCDSNSSIEEKDHLWLDDEPVGRELI